MIRINLLPHREERRKAQRRQLGVLADGAAVAAIAVALLVHGVIAGYVGAQNSRNGFLTRENAKLDIEIAEIKKLKGEIQALLSRKQIIETLQSDRSKPVTLLEGLVRQTPEGVYLKSLKQTGNRVNVTGYAQSSARVSMFMRNLQTVPIIESSALSPQLVEIKAATVNNRRVSEFNLNFLLKQPATEDSAKSTAASPLKKG
jgi:type IV pilus assembly protein PilN